MEKYCRFRRQEIPHKPDLFASCLEKIFGRAAVIEKTVLRKLYSKLGIDF